MKSQEQAYFWGRLIRAVARGSLMVEAQRADLAAEILSKDPTEELKQAAAKLVAGTLAAEDVTAHIAEAKSVDAEAFRQAKAARPDENAQADARLNALLNAE